jgi:hypothetical protein
VAGVSEQEEVAIVAVESPVDGKEPLRDISHLGVWSLSGAKPGNGVDQLLDDNVRVTTIASLLYMQMHTQRAACSVQRACGGVVCRAVVVQDAGCCCWWLPLLVRLKRFGRATVLRHTL